MLAGGVSEASESRIGQRLSGRYRLERSLGRGGAAEVFAAFDEQTGRMIALKCLLDHTSPGTAERMGALFRHEFLVLSQVTHGSVIAAYDFGFADGLPFYTMELVDGRPLAQAAPLPPETVIALMKSLCEPLAVVHSRRWVHRDLSPRNVICMDSGAIKLIDFGATVSMDEHHPPVGTPPCMPPEVLHQEPLDATADVFGLGALAYYALTGRYAYPARSLAALPRVWGVDPKRASEHVPGIPSMLDDLLMAMLSIDRSARPRSMAEVLHRLNGGSRASLPPSVGTARAYLDTPKLIGRDRDIAQLKVLLRGAQAGRGTACVVRGEAGSGRSRMLDTAGLEGRVVGFAIGRASGRQAGNTPLSLVRALSTSILAALAQHEHQSRAATAPEWLRSGEAIVESASDELANAQRELVDWISAVCGDRPLLLLIDDFESADSASQRCLAQLAMLAKKLRLVLAVSADDAAASKATPLRVILENGAAIQLAALSDSEVEDWVRSVFGDVPNVARLARWLSPISAGLPAACLQLAQYLVDHGIVMLSGGSWRLPDHFEDLGLPSSLREALGARLGKLEPPARQLLQLLATEVQPLPHALSVYIEAFGSKSGDPLEALSQLTAAQALTATAAGYTLGGPAILEWAREQLAADSSGAIDRKEALHRQLAEWHRTRATEQDPSPIIYACYHLCKAGDLDAADVVLGDSTALRTATTSASAQFSRSDEGIALYEALLAHRKRKGQSPAAVHQLLQTLLVLAQASRPELVVHADECVQRLVFDIGLDQWDGLPPELSDQERLTQCLTIANARYEATPESERGLPVLGAIRRLASTVAVLSGVYSVRYEPAGIVPLVTIMRRVRSLSPALALISDMMDAALVTLGAGADMREMQRNIVESTREPIAQIDDPTRIGVHVIYNYYFGMHLASEGDDDALRYAPILEALPLYASLGLQIRRHHALMTGNYREALRFRRQRELLALQSETSDHHLHMSLLRELGSALACADVLELARTTSAIKRKAARFAGWQPWLTLCNAAQHFVAREHARALELADEGLRAVPPFSHSSFHSFVSIKADALNELGEYAQAQELLRETIAGARAIGIRLDKESRLHAALALSAAGLGETARGLAILEEQLEAIGAQPGKGSLLYAQLCETGCRIALMTNDLEAFSRHYEPMSKLYARHPGLRAVAERWRRAGRDRFETRDRQTGELHADIAVDWHTLIATAIGTQSSEERASYLLSLLLEQVEAEQGQLYRVDPSGRPQLMASTPTPADPTLIVQAAKHCGSRTTTDITQTQSMTSEEATVDSAGRRYQLLWLLEPSDPERTHGLVMIGEPGASLGQITPALRNAITQHLQALA